MGETIWIEDKSWGADRSVAELVVVKRTEKQIRVARCSESGWRTALSSSPGSEPLPWWPTRAEAVAALRARAHGRVELARADLQAAVMDAAAWDAVLLEMATMPDLTLVSEAATRAAVRHCSPVVHPDHGRGVVCMWPDDDDGSIEVNAWCDIRTYRSVEAMVSAGWRLDPTDATGRAHLAWAIAAWWQTARGSGSTSHHPLTGCVWWPAGARSWGLQWSGTSVAFVPWDADAPTYVQVQDLADLDPADPTTLPDGSRWVDAEALVRVANHVLEPTDAT